MFAERRGILLALALGALSVGYHASAHVRILNPSSGAPLFWPSGTSTSIAFQAVGSDNLSDDSDEVAVRNAIAAWNSAAGSNFTLVEDTSAATQARTDWSADDLHMVLFDESGASGYFPGNSGTVALTPLWFYSSGAISDADIIFNGKDFNFTTSGEPGRFDVQDVAVHEIGHFLGLDHSGFTGASMYPYVDPTVILHRSLSLDDRNGVRIAYPGGGSFATLTGRVERPDESAVLRAHVVALDAEGRTAGATLANHLGNFALGGLDPGTYTIYVDPFDNPVSSINLTGSYSVDVDYSTTFYPGSVTVTAGESLDLGTLTVEPDVALQLGRSTDRLPRRGTIGATTGHTLRGTGLSSGSTLTVSDPDMTVGSVNWLGTIVTFSLTVPAGESPGHVDLIVENASGDVDRLVAGIEIAPPDPTVSTVSLATVSQSGGSGLTIGGSGFRPGARVVIGDQIYVDGEPNGSVVVDANTITLTTLPTVGGVHDVVVIDETGVEGRAVDAMTFTDVPSLDGIFPTVGSVGGGTSVTIVGQDFVDEAEVYFGGVPAHSATVVSPNRIDAVSPSSLGAGTVTLQVVNPGGLTSDSSFTYVAQADPVLTALSPTSGSSAGGDLVTISGANFGASTVVRFGVDALDGSGGTPATGVTLIDANTLQVITPPGSGSVAVMVTDPVSGQVDVLSAGFQYVAQGSGSGGGGCGSITTPGPGSWQEVAAGAGWVLFLLSIAVARALWARGRATAPARVRA